MIPAGMLSELVTIQRNTSTAGVNQHGEPTEAWTTLHQPWVRVTHLTGKEAFTASQDIGIRTVEFAMHYNSTVSGVTDADRVLWSSDTYDVESVEVKRSEGEVIVIGRQTSGA